MNLYHLMILVTRPLVRNAQEGCSTVDPGFPILAVFRLLGQPSEMVASSHISLLAWLQGVLRLYCQ